MVQSGHGSVVADIDQVCWVALGQTRWQNSSRFDTLGLPNLHGQHKGGVAYSDSYSLMRFRHNFTDA